MFDKLSGMAQVAKVASAAMRGDKGAIAELLKPELPGIMTTAVKAIVVVGGGNPDTDGAFLWEHTKRDGTRTIMATVYKRNDLDEPGDIIATLDVHQALATMDLAQYING